MLQYILKAQLAQAYTIFTKLTVLSTTPITLITGGVTSSSLVLFMGTGLVLTGIGCSLAWSGLIRFCWGNVLGADGWRWSLSGEEGSSNLLGRCKRATTIAKSLQFHINIEARTKFTIKQNIQRVLMLADSGYHCGYGASQWYIADCLDASDIIIIHTHTHRHIYIYIYIEYSQLKT